MVKTPINIYFEDSLSNLRPSSLIAYKQKSSSKFKIYATDKNGALVELDSPTSTGITNIINTDGYLNISGGTIKTVNIDNSLFLEIQDLIENYSYLIKTSAESIPSYTPIALINNLAYKLDSSIEQHKFAFAGFSVNGTTIGQNCRIKQQGELELLNWGLIPNTQYLAGQNGSLITDNTNPLNFTKVVGYATTSNTLQIIKDYTSIIK